MKYVAALLLLALAAPAADAQSGTRRLTTDDHFYDITVTEARQSTADDEICGGDLAGAYMLTGFFRYRDIEIARDWNRHLTGSTYGSPVTEGRIVISYSYAVRARPTPSGGRRLIYNSAHLGAAFAYAGPFEGRRYGYADGRGGHFWLPDAVYPDSPGSLSPQRAGERPLRFLQVQGDNTDGLVAFGLCMPDRSAGTQTSTDSLKVSFNRPYNGDTGPGLEYRTVAPDFVWGLSGDLPLDPTLFEPARAPLMAVPPTSPCLDDTLIDTFDRDHDDYHVYPTSHWSEDEWLVSKICSFSDSKCTPANVFSIFLADAAHAAPTEETGPIQQCGSLMADILDPSSLSIVPNPVVTAIDHDHRSVTNYTAPGHLLHPGKVVRRIAALDDGVYVATWGEGTGDYGLANTVFSHALWSHVDRRVRDAFVRWSFRVE